MSGWMAKAREERPHIFVEAFMFFYGLSEKRVLDKSVKLPLTPPGLRGVNPEPGNIAIRDIHGIRDSFPLPPSPLHCNAGGPASIISSFWQRAGIPFSGKALSHFSIHP